MLHGSIGFVLEDHESRLNGMTMSGVSPVF